MNPVLQTRKLRHREIKECIHCHRAKLGTQLRPSASSTSRPWTHVSCSPGGSRQSVFSESRPRVTGQVGALFSLLKGRKTRVGTPITAQTHVSLKGSTWERFPFMPQVSQGMSCVGTKAFFLLFLRGLPARKDPGISIK